MENEDASRVIESAPPELPFTTEARELLARLVNATIAKRKLEAELKEAKAKVAELEEPVRDIFARLGVDSLRIRGYSVSPSSTWWAGAFDKDYATACAALREAGLDEFVQERFNTNTVSAWVRELERTVDGQPILPEALQGKLKVSEKQGVRVVKST